MANPVSTTYGSHSSIERIVWTDDDDNNQINQKKSFAWHWCFRCCFIGSLVAGIGLAIVLAFWLTSKTTTTTETLTQKTTVSTSTMSTTLATTTTTISTSNWLINGDGETGSCQVGYGITSPTGWMYNGPVTQIYYSASDGDLNSTTSGPSNRGQCYFYGQISNVTSMWQYVNLTSSINPVLIDNQTVRFNFSAWLGGYYDQDDNVQVSLMFINQLNQAVGSTVVLGPVLAIDRGNVSKLLFRQTSGLVPTNARSLLVTATMIRTAGIAYNDGCVDNIYLYFYQ
ncbi:unnamed protein product [Adineta steineri]|uniref:Uncharacterized protein n=1 Tax=Adineta steineri TaxID=433720 RepID=A0A815UF43_9BILA|nr:unnamed protein product [Adineta steineri]CAF1518969.1 unnamed protein product [Adineta steineri]